MGKKSPAKFQTKVREVYSDFNDEGRVGINEIVDEVTRRHSGLVEAEKDRLLRESIAGILRKMINRDTSPQLMLPGELSKVDLPTRIAIRPPGKKAGPAEWVLIEEVTYLELDTKVESLEPKQRPDRRRFALKRTRDFLLPHMAENHRHDPIGPVLKRLALADVVVGELTSA